MSKKLDDVAAVRQALFGADRPQSTGCMAWRGVIPIDRMPDGLARPVGTNWVGPGRHVIHYLLRRGEPLLRCAPAWYAPAPAGGAVGDAADAPASAGVGGPPPSGPGGTARQHSRLAGELLKYRIACGG